MPTYEYRCPSCGTEFEKFQKMSDAPVAECPSCGAASERRLSAGAGLLFKGSGFYITDYRGDGYRKAQKAEGGGAVDPPGQLLGDLPRRPPERLRVGEGGGSSASSAPSTPAPAPKSDG